MFVRVYDVQTGCFFLYGTQQSVITLSHFLSGQSVYKSQGNTVKEFQLHMHVNWR